MMRQYEMAEWTVSGTEPEDSWVETDLSGTFQCGDFIKKVGGFYAGNGTHKVRFMPLKTGRYQVRITGSCLGETRCFEEECLPAAPGQHGPVRAEGTHFRYEDGTWFYPFGTTVYALSHQEDDLVEQTFRTLQDAPFNKIRICVFPKHFPYNTNEPPYYAFARNADAAQEPAGYTALDPDQWDVHHPDLRFWDRLEEHLIRLGQMGIQVDLILFHSYDRWGFSKLPLHKAMVYLEYLTRRLSAFPNLWWSMGNEYDIMDYSGEDWKSLAQFLHGHDPYGHLLSGHQIVLPWDFAEAGTTHVCLQTSDIMEISLQAAEFGKPVMIDEMGYEGNLPQNWGNLSGRELVRRFWIVTMQGGYATHGETFLHPQDVIWWARGGRLRGEAPKRIAFLRSILESIGGPLTFHSLDMTEEEFVSWKERMIPHAGMPNIDRILYAAGWQEAKPLLLGDRELEGSYGEQAFIKYYDLRCTARGEMNLPESGSYTVEVIDTWEMTRTVVQSCVSGAVTVDLPGKEGMALLAIRV